jgi:transposase
MLNRLEGVGETLRAALNALAASAPEWLRERVPGEWFERYSRRIEDYRLPKGEEARRAYAEQLGADGQQVLLWLAQETPSAALRRLSAVQILRHVWEQQYIVDAGRMRWRTVEELEPAGARIDSPSDPDAHYGTKRTTSWVGYKVHLTETCAEEAPNLIIQVLTTSAAERDIQRTLDIEAALMQRGLPPAQHLVDAGYVGGCRGGRVNAKPHAVWH